MLLRFTPSQSGPLRIWRLPEARRAYAIGVDTAGGKTTNDWSCATVVDVMTSEDVAQWRGHMEPRPFADEVMKLVEFYGGSFGQAFTVVEVNNHGLVVVERLLDLGATNLYARHEVDRVPSAGAETRLVYGFNTTQKTKPRLVSAGRVTLAHGGIPINSLVTLNELATMIRDAHDRISAADGCHDDAAISWMLALVGADRCRDRLGENDQSRETGDEPKPISHRDWLVKSQAWVWKRQEEKQEERRASRRVVHECYN